MHRDFASSSAGLHSPYQVSTLLPICGQWNSFRGARHSRTTIIRRVPHNVLWAWFGVRGKGKFAAWFALGILQREGSFIATGLRHRR